MVIIKDNSIVSIIIPSYNYEKFIEDCLLSVFKQTYRNIELVIIDDYSKDESVEKISKLVNSDDFKNRFTNINFIARNSNKGAHVTINEGISLSTGEYIAILNADDLYQDNRVEVCVNLLKNSNSLLAFSKVKIIGEDTEVVNESEELEYFENIQKNIEKYASLSLAFLPQNVAISTGNFFFKKELINKIGVFRNFKYIHDWDFVLRSLLISEPIYTEETNYYYRLHQSNSFRELGNIADREVYTVLTQLFRMIKNNIKQNNSLMSTNNFYSLIEKVINENSLSNYWNNSNGIKAYYYYYIQKVRDISK